MKIILNQDVVGLGEEGDIREVAEGYARNYLLPRKLAVAHNRQSLAQFTSRKSAIEGRKDEKRKEAMGLKERLEAEELQFTMPAGESGKLFGSVNNALIGAELEKRGYSIEKTQDRGAGTPHPADRDLHRQGQALRQRRGGAEGRGGGEAGRSRWLPPA